MQLTREQAHALGHRNGVFAQRFEARGDACLGEIEAAVDAAMIDFPGCAFARLGSRSAKDTSTGVLTGSQVRSGAETLRLLTNGSRRVGYDLHLALRHGLRPWLFLREWHDIAWATELRCFLREGELVGISQYHTALSMPGPDRRRAERSRPGIERLAEALLAALGGVSLVFDVCVDCDGHLTLIELNPWGPPTEAVLFRWDASFDGALRLV